MELFAYICAALLIAGALALIGFELWDRHLERKAGKPPQEDEPPTDEFPVVDVSWEERSAWFAAYVDNFAEWVASRRRALETPTAEYRVYVRREFGVALADVGPREITCRVTEGLPTLQAVAR